MPEEYLQTAFEIKAACDEISRRLLRWHWEQKPGVHSLDALRDYLEQRKKESPDYYDRLPDLSGRTSWQQLDTTLCMRVLLDPEKNAAHPLDLLGNTPRPGAARRACNAVRAARNEAAHAADRAGSIQAAILFNEAVEALEEGYAGAALRESELAQYYRQAEQFLARCGKTSPSAPASEPEDAAPPVQEPAAPRASAPPRAARPAEKNAPRRSPPRSASPASAPRKSGTASRTTKKSASGDKKRPSAPRKNRREQQKADHAVLVVLLLISLAGVLLRGCTMGAFSI